MGVISLQISDTKWYDIFPLNQVGMCGILAMEFLQYPGFQLGLLYGREMQRDGFQPLRCFPLSERVYYSGALLNSQYIV